ncbi:MAG: glutamate racemase [Candidatus Doudnabacteria bacterium CG10_big_fil_rev_8_21_14_0_10_42_18]|uniref:Glutamate racemase n=1 Tax=Candidatus Doudnabacteria bacterium CG10_big_fil_rev_8_21_14_0_10_42_18 TaxID=1974552 RepID=A0A2H0VB50_9BACT|nr:MAG: glutamate racemase [Candidatus Doudnabacteria bacterium CG10_big_fil_rev_8_21_14_0_10_42_18]
MKIGIFDSGLGGLIIAKAVIKKLPKYDYAYLGDTKRVPYGNRSQATVYEFTRQAVEYLFKKQNCQLIILACNTASSEALRKIQQSYLPKNFPNRRVLGVIIPTMETVAEDKKNKRVGVLATSGTVNSHIYKKELKKLTPKIKIVEQAAPLLVPLAEFDGMQYSDKILKNYLKPLITAKVNKIVLGCTHYPLFSNKIKKIVGGKVDILSQDKILPGKLKEYLKKHKETDTKLSRNGKRKFLVTDVNQNLKQASGLLFGKSIKFKMVRL